eukprot:403343953
MLIFFYAHSYFCGQNLLDIKNGFQKFLIMRIVLGTMNDTFLYLSYEYVSYAKATSIQFGGSFVVPFLAYFMLGDKIHKSHLIFIFFGFIGILLMVQPYQSLEEVESQEITGDDNSLYRQIIGSGMAFGAAVTSALIMILIRILQQAGLHYSIVPTYYALGNMMSSPFLSYLSPKIQEQIPIEQKPFYDATLLLIFFAIGLNLYISNALFTKAYNYSQPSVLAIVQYVAMPITFIQDIVFFHELPHLMESIGATLILASNLSIAYYEYKQKRD